MALSLVVAVPLLPHLYKFSRVKLLGEDTSEDERAVKEFVAMLPKLMKE